MADRMREEPGGQAMEVRIDVDQVVQDVCRYDPIT